MKYGVIYRIVNTVNGKAYIGQTTAEPFGYWQTHLSYARLGTKKLLWSAIRKHGEAAFTFEVVWSAFDKPALDAAEDYYILEEGTLVPLGYNLKRGGSRGKFSEEMRLERSRILKIACSSPEIRARYSAIALEVGKRPEIKALRSKNSKKMHADPAFKEKHRAAVNAPETREKIIAGIKISHARPEFREMQRATQLARFADPAERERIAELTRQQMADPVKKARHKAAYDNPTTRAKISEIHSGTSWATDGTKNQKLKPGQALPPGWTYGISNYGGTPDARANAQLLGRHTRWHANRGVKSPSCPLCASTDDAAQQNL